MRYRANELRRGEDGFWRCVAYCVEVPSITRDKIATMSSKRKEAPPPPHGTPFDRANAYAAEAQIFNFLCEQPVRDANWPGGFRLGLPPYDYVDVTNGGVGALAPNPQTDTVVGGSTGYSVLCAGETCRYLYGIINDNKRPLRWISVAKTKLRELADWLITKQRGFGIAPTATKTNDGLWGGVVSQDSLSFNGYIAVDNASAGLALLYAFRVLGDAKYLVSAKASASFLRNMQAAPNPPYLGALPVYLFTIASISPAYYPSALIALEFWNELLTTSGDAQYGSDGTPAGFTAIPQQLLSLCIADLRGFWRTGARDATLGTVVNGLSSATLCEYLLQSDSTTWQRIDGALATSGTIVIGRTIAMALRSLYAYEGYSSQVADVWSYLMALGSNPLFVTAAGTLATDYLCAVGTDAANPSAPRAGQGNVVAPFFNPKLTLSTAIEVKNIVGNSEDYYWTLVTIPNLHRSTYDWTTFGLMAAIQSAKDQGNFKKAKDAAVATRYRMPTTFVDFPVEETVLLRGSSGLAFQLSQFDDVNVNGVPSSRLASATAAAMIGNAFRYAPQGYTGSPAPGQPYSQKPPGVQA